MSERELQTPKMLIYGKKMINFLISRSIAQSKYTFLFTPLINYKNYYLQNNLPSIITIQDETDIVMTWN